MSMIIILDVSVIISSLCSQRNSYGKDILERAFQQDFFLATCKTAYDELRSTLQKPKIKKIKGYDPRANAQFIAWYKYNAKWFQIDRKRQKPISRDIHDEYYFYLIDASQAEYLITLDDDLLTIKSYKKSKIITPNQFILTK